MSLTLLIKRGLADKRKKEELPAGKSKETNQKKNWDAAKGRYFTKNKSKTM